MPYKNCKWEGIFLSAPSTYRSARHANEYFNESGKIKKQSKRYFDPNDPFLWTSYHEQDCPCVEKARGHRSNKANKQPTVKAGG